MGLLCSEMMSIDPLLEDVVRAWDDLSGYLNEPDYVGDGSAYETIDRPEERSPSLFLSIRPRRLLAGA